MFVFCFRHSASIVFRIDVFFLPHIFPLIRDNRNGVKFQEFDIELNGSFAIVVRLKFGGRLESPQSSKDHSSRHIQMEMPSNIHAQYVSSNSLGYTVAHRHHTTYRIPQLDVSSIRFAKSKIKQNSIMKFTKTAQIIK